MRRRAFVLCAAVSLAAHPGAADMSVTGALTGEMRYFPEAPAFPGQSDDPVYLSYTLDARFTYGSPAGDNQVVVAPFLRFGGAGDGRDHFDLREAYWRHQGDGWSLTTGVDKVFWGVTESRHLVDIVNQDDVLEDIDGEDKLGQPMVNLSFFGALGTLDFYVLPYFREREYQEFGARLGGPLPFGRATYDSPHAESHVDFAFRWGFSRGNWDVGLSYFAGTSREPKILFTFPELTPHYDQIRQVGLDLQYTAGAWLWKLEAIRRQGQGPIFWAATGGFEVTLPDVVGTGADLGLIAEWNHDGREMAFAPLTIYEDDLFLGARLTLNNTGDTSLLAGALIDWDSDERLYLVEGQHRLGENWLLSLEAKLFYGSSPLNLIWVVENDDYWSLSLKRSF